MVENETTFFGANIPKEIKGKLNTEVVLKFGRTHGNMSGCLEEAIKLWIEKSKKERKQKEKSTKNKKVEEINSNV